MEIYCGWCDLVSAVNGEEVDWEELLHCPECEAPTRIWLVREGEIYF